MSKSDNSDFSEPQRPHSSPYAHILVISTATSAFADKHSVFVSDILSASTGAGVLRARLCFTLLGDLKQLLVCLFSHMAFAAWEGAL